MLVICRESSNCPKEKCPHREPHEMRGTCVNAPCYVVNNKRVECVKVVVKPILDHIDAIPIDTEIRREVI